MKGEKSHFESKTIHTPPSHGAVHSAGIADAGGSVVTIGRFISDGISGGGMLVYADQGTARLVVLVCWLLDVPYGPPSNVLTSLVFMTNEVATARGSVPAARADPSRSARRIDGPQTHSLNSRGNRRQPRYVHKSVRIYLPPAANCQSVGPISAHHTDCGCAPQISPAQQQTLGRGRNLNAALSWTVAVGKRLQEFHNQILFVIGQLKITYRHIQVLIIVGWWKAVHVEPLPCARLTGPDLILVAGIIEMHHFFQAYEVSIMHVGFYKCVRR